MCCLFSLKGAVNGSGEKQGSGMELQSAETIEQLICKEVQELLVQVRTMTKALEHAQESAKTLEVLGTRRDRLGILDGGPPKPITTNNGTQYCDPRAAESGQVGTCARMNPPSASTGIQCGTTMGCGAVAQKGNNACIPLHPGISYANQAYPSNIPSPQAQPLPPVSSLLPSSSATSPCGAQPEIPLQRTSETTAIGGVRNSRTVLDQSGDGGGCASGGPEAPPATGGSYQAQLDGGCGGAPPPGQLGGRFKQTKNSPFPLGFG